MQNLVSKAVVAVLLSMMLIAAPGGDALAQKQYDIGATDTEIKIGNIMPYSGPASAFAAIGKTEAAYFTMINEQGGINGRKITFISYDDGYSPPKTIEQTRRLVESDEVLLLFNIVGTPGNAAIQKYVNQKKIPHLFISSGGARWNDPKNFPWSMNWWPSFKSEARIYAKYILQNHPGKTVGILYQNDDFGRDYLAGFREVFAADAAKIILLEVPYDLSAVTVDSEIVQIKAVNPDIFVNIATPKFAAQAIKKVGELGWKPVQFVSNVSASVQNVMMVAGVEHSRDIISAVYLKEPSDPRWKDDAGINEFRAFMRKYYPEGDAENSTTVFGYGAAKALAQVLGQCGDDLTRANIMRQMTSLNMEINVYLPGINITTSPTDYAPIDQFQLVKFDGERFVPFSPVIGGK